MTTGKTIALTKWTFAGKIYIIRELQIRITERNHIAIPFSRRSSWPKDQTWVSCISGRFFTVWATRKAHIYLLERPKSRSDNTKCWWGCGTIGSLLHCRWECRMVQPPWKRVPQFCFLFFFYKTKRTCTMQSSNSSPWYSPKWTETYLHTKSSMLMFITTLFIIFQTRNQPAYTWVGEWYIQTMKYYPVIRWNVLPGREKTWINPQYILLNERSRGNDNPVCEMAKETQMYRTVLWILWERERVGWFGRMALKHI